MMRDPTMRKVLRQGYVPIRYRSKDAAHNGWIIEGTLGVDKVIRVELVGFERTYRLGVEEQAFITIIAP